MGDLAGKLVRDRSSNPAYVPVVELLNQARVPFIVVGGWALKHDVLFDRES